MKTQKEIQGDFFAMLQGSTIAKAVSGNVYRSDGVSSMRPRDSRLEDIEVIVTRAFAEQVQNGVVTILIYVPDIHPFDNAVGVEDGARLEQLSRVAQDWFDSIPEVGTNYTIALNDVVSVVSIEEIGQHAVSLQLKYNYFE